MMQRHILSALALCLFLAPLTAADPMPPTPTPAPSITQLIDAVTAARAKKVDAEKAEQLAMAALQAKVKELLDQLKALGLAVDPPAPPKPPDPPAPTDPLVSELQTLYTSDAAPDKAKALTALRDLYKQATDLAGSPDVETAGQLLDAVKATAAKMIPAGSLSALRSRLGAEMNRTLPTDPAAALTVETRKQVCDSFGRLAKALEMVK